MDMINNDGDVNFTNLVSELVTIRRMEESDIIAFHKYRANSEVARFQSWSDYSLEDASIFVNNQKTNNPNIPGQWIQLAVVLNDTGTIAGDCAFCSDPDQTDLVEMGVTISSENQRRGVATNALCLLLRYLFIDLNKHRVVVTIDALNTASIALFRKLRFRQEGHFVENVFFKGAWGSEVQFAMLKREYIELNEDMR